MRASIQSILFCRSKSFIYNNLELQYAIEYMNASSFRFKITNILLKSQIYAEKM